MNHRIGFPKIQNKSIAKTDTELLSFDRKSIPERKKRVLCSNVDKVVYLAGRITLRFRPDDENHAIAAEIVKAAKEIKEQALAMEKRLYLYKETIETLGFKRVRK